MFSLDSRFRGNDGAVVAGDNATDTDGAAAGTVITVGTGGSTTVVTVATTTIGTVAATTVVTVVTTTAMLQSPRDDESGSSERGEAGGGFSPFFARGGGVTGAALALADGTVFRGESVGAVGVGVGEVVFNTALTGYQEILTDPSYARQLVTLTHPHIGNTGATGEDDESRGVFCAGLIVKNIPPRHSNWRSDLSLPAYLQDHGVVAIAGVDTRKLTRLIREGGAQSGCIIAGESADEATALAAAKEFPGIKGADLAKVVTTGQSYRWTGGGWDIKHGYTKPPPAKHKVVAVDFGVKHNILRLLAMRGCEMTVTPATTGADEILKHNPDGVFLSNGPGDPEPCDYAIDAIKELLCYNIPLFGICLGHQLLALAAGGETEKMKFGHHGANHPVRDVDDGRVLITSQNHGFAVRESSLPAHLRVTHRSLFDGSVQGLAHTDRPAFSFQGHPEASPGPHDVGGLFDRFIKLMHDA